MTALDLVLRVKRHGVQFVIFDDSLIVSGAENLPDALRQDLLNRIDDCRAVVREHSRPTRVTGIDVVDAARELLRERRPSKALR